MNSNTATIRAAQYARAAAGCNASLIETHGVASHDERRAAGQLTVTLASWDAARNAASTTAALGRVTAKDRARGTLLTLTLGQGR
jgi:hypothetical protein